jgi:uroporphyrinogen decarboxylase
MGMEVLMNPAPSFPAPLDTPADIARLREHVDVHKELGYVFAAITRTRHGLAGEVPLIGFCGAPWTLFSYMVEGGGSKTLQKAKTWLFKHPQETKKLLARIADICIDFLVGQVDAGAQVSPPSLHLSPTHSHLTVKSLRCVVTPSIRLVGGGVVPG